MSKPTTRVLSQETAAAVSLIGSLIREARIAGGMTAAELSERAGVSRGLVHRIEKGDTSCSIGAVFEAATIVGVPLFGIDADERSRRLAHVRDKLALLPDSVRTSRKPVMDDF